MATKKELREVSRMQRSVLCWCLQPKKHQGIRQIFKICYISVKCHMSPYQIIGVLELFIVKSCSRQMFELFGLQHSSQLRMTGHTRTVQKFVGS